MIEPHVIVNPLFYMAVVTVLIVWRLDYGVLDCQSFVSSDPFADQLCVSPLGALPSSLVA